jgi:hypothetical protein
MSAINFPLATTSLFVNTLTTNKIIYLPAASTIGAGRLFYIKDICGNAARSSIYISTIGMDRIENRHQPSTLYAVMSTNYGSILMAPDGALNWYFLQHYHRNAISSLGAAVAVATGAFTPTSITGLRMWFDAADAATLTLSSGIVTQWADKSGTGNTLIPLSGKANATVSSAYQNGLNVLNFSGNSLYRSPLGSATYPQDVYIIVALKSLTAHNDVLGMGDTTADNFNSFTFAENVARRWQNGSSFGSRLIYSPTDETSTSFLLMQWSIANNNFLLRRNGTQLVQSSSITYSFSNPSAAAFQIGYRHTDQTGASNFSGYIGEILLFNTQLGTTDREKIEGYLAWKWGLQASLPASHTYLSAPPGGFTPLTVSGIGLQVWLDGADPAGTGTAPADTASISTWTDKSGNGYNFTATSAATYSTTNKAPYFNNNYYTSTYTAAPVTETGFVVFKLNSTAAPQIIIGANNGGREVSVANTFGDFGIIKSQVAWGQTVSGLTNSTTTLSTWQITSQTNTYISLNGALSLSGPTSIGTFTNGVTTGLGREATASIPVYGWVMEIVMFNTQLSQTNQQKMEGYLAWKWGSQASLPAGHPYKSAAPTS